MVIERERDFHLYMTADDALNLIESLSRALRGDTVKSFSVRPARILGESYPYLSISVVSDANYQDIVSTPK